MALAAILGLVRDVSAQTVDPLTTTQAGGGAGATWVSIPSSLFAQRQVQRFNNTTGNVGSGAWTVSGNLNATTGNARLNYRQNNAGATIDLSGITSMSFNITVVGSVTGNWNLMDTNGLIIELPADFALSAGAHTVTLDFSTAAIDDGFDFSAVTGMSVFLSGIQAGESATVTNFIYTPLPAAVPIDTLTLAQNSSGNGFGAAWASPPGSLFTVRQVARFNSAGTGTASIGGGAWTAFLPRATSGTASASVLTYRQNRFMTSTIDLSSITKMEFDINVIAGSVSGYFYLMDENGFIAEVPGGFVRSVGTSSVTLNLSTAAIDPGFDLSRVVEMRIWISATSVNSRFSVTNLESQ